MARWIRVKIQTHKLITGDSVTTDQAALAHRWLSSHARRNDYQLVRKDWNDCQKKL